MCVLNFQRLPVSKSPNSTSIKTLSLFSGGGGLELGFAASGYSILGSTDIDFHSCQTLELNSRREPFYSPDFILQKDITELNAYDLLTPCMLLEGETDMLIGGPPCQAFSIFGKRKGLDDSRGNLIWDYLRMVETIKPEAFVFENVEGLATIHGGELFEELQKALSLEGEYTISAHCYDVANFGIPQHRKRIFFIGTKNGVIVPEMQPTHGETNLLNSLSPFVTVNSALSKMPKPGIDSNVPNHIGRNHSQRIIDRYQGLRFGERDPKTRINKLHPNRPSYTIIVGSDKGGGKGHVHPYDPREVTPRESARIQTFPDWWEFYGKGRHVIRQVGNAVPPLFAAILANHVKKYVFGSISDLNYDELVRILELDFLQEAHDQRLLQP